MQISTIFLATLGAIGVSADTITQLGVPKTIQPNTPFSLIGLKVADRVTADDTIQIGFHAQTIGYGPYQLGSLWDGPHKILNKWDGSPNTTIPGISLPIAENTPITIKALVTRFTISPYNQPSMTVFSINTTISARTSDEYSWSKKRTESTSCNFV